MTTEPLHIHTERHGDDVLLHTVVGEVDTNTQPVLRRALTTPADGRSLVVDLTGLKFLSAAGVRVLHEVARDAAADDRRFVIVVGSSMVERVITFIGAGDIVVHRTLAAALRTADLHTPLADKRRC